MKTFNPNDISASIYDIFTRPLKGKEVTELEIELVKSIVKPGERILDIGCGTGRHAIPLAQTGYKVTGIDSSEEMIKIAKQKSEVNFSTCDNTPLFPPSRGGWRGVISPQFIKASILTYNLSPNTYNLITLFWNSFNEICLTKKDAEVLLKKLKKSLKPDGKILLNMDRAEWMKDLKDFETEYEKDGLVYKQYWTIKKYNKRTNVTTSEENVVVTSEQGNIVLETKALIKQRWWNKKELEVLSRKVGLNLSQTPIKNINESYYILTKDR